MFIQFPNKMILNTDHITDGQPFPYSRKFLGQAEADKTTYLLHLTAADEQGGRELYLTAEEEHILFALLPTIGQGEVERRDRRKLEQLAEAEAWKAGKR